MSDEPCSRRGQMVRPGFHLCPSNRILHPEPGIVPLSTCAICPYRNLPDREGVPAVQSANVERARDAIQRLHETCAHRLEVIEVGVCTACGMRGQPFDVYACAKHGKCMVRRFRSDRADLKVCFNCDDYVPADANVAAEAR